MMAVPRNPDPPISKAAARLWFRRWNAMARLLGMCGSGIPFAVAYEAIQRRAPVAAGPDYRLELLAAWHERLMLCYRPEAQPPANPFHPSHFVKRGPWRRKKHRRRDG